LMLRHLDRQAAARRIERAVEATLAAGESLTPDLGGEADTSEMTQAILSRLQASSTPETSSR